MSQIKAVVTIEACDAESTRRLKEWLASAHGAETPTDEALRDEIGSWLADGSKAKLSVGVEVQEGK